MTEIELAEYLKRNPNLRVRDIFTPAPDALIESGIAKGSIAAPKMNKLESAYAQVLEIQKYQRKILDWKYEPMNLKLSGMKCFYRIDFLIISANLEIELHETKGNHVFDDALVKFKVASEQFPFFIFRWVTRVNGEFITRTAIGGKWI